MAERSLGQKSRFSFKEERLIDSLKDIRMKKSRNSEFFM
jgi:hypothetical protein